MHNNENIGTNDLFIALFLQVCNNHVFRIIIAIVGVI